MILISDLVISITKVYSNHVCGKEDSEQQNLRTAVFRLGDVHNEDN